MTTKRTLDEMIKDLSEAKCPAWALSEIKKLESALEAERSLRIELQNVLEQVRSKLYLETDRDQATMGMLDLHKPISEVFDKCRNHEERESKP